MKIALVTGANRGLGLGFVKYLLSIDYYVFACTRDATNYPISQINLKPITLDITDDERILNAVKEVSRIKGNLDLLINNAGVSKDTILDKQIDKVNEITKLDRNTMNKMFDINSISPMIVIKNFLPLLSKSKLAFIINISSARASFKDEWGFSSYNYGYRGSKAALNIMTKALVENLPENIKTFSVDPGDVKTDMNPEGETLPVKTGTQIINIIQNWKNVYNGEFMRFSGEPYPK